MSKVAREYLKLDTKGRPWTHLVCRQGLLRRWRKGRAARGWHRAYRHLFDDDDLRLAKSQSAHHLVEWVAAIHFFQTRGVRAVVAKWKERAASRRGGFSRYPGKAQALKDVLGGPRFERLNRGLRGIGPDLFLYHPKSGRYWFAEIKRVGDRLNHNQLRDFMRIERRLRIPVQLVRVHVR